MNRTDKHSSSKRKGISLILALLALIALVGGFVLFNPFGKQTSSDKKDMSSSSSASSKEVKEVKYEPSQEEKEYLANRFAQLTSVNPEAIAYVYAPGTELDEPVVQTGDNATYLDKTFEGGNQPLMGTVFMDTDNKKDFSYLFSFIIGFFYLISCLIILNFDILIYGLGYIFFSLCGQGIGFLIGKLRKSKKRAKQS